MRWPRLCHHRLLILRVRKRIRTVSFVNYTILSTPVLCPAIHLSLILPGDICTYASLTIFAVWPLETASTNELLQQTLEAVEADISTLQQQHDDRCASLQARIEVVAVYFIRVFVLSRSVRCAIYDGLFLAQVITFLWCSQSRRPVGPGTGILQARIPGMTAQ